jgi:ribosome biogenesis GTPase
MNLADLGFDSFFENQFETHRNQGRQPARVVREHRRLYQVLGTSGELTAEVSGRFSHNTRSRADYPTVGDWVAVTARPEEKRATIQALLKRKSAFSRKAVLSGGMPETGGRTDQQVLAANIDTVFLVSGLDHDFNVRRIERYLTVAWESGANPIVILNKADLCEDVADRADQLRSSLAGVPLLVMSATSGRNLESLHEYLADGRTAAFLGSSGVGKSTIINALLGSEQIKVAAVREDDSRGRHTTTTRELFILPSGGIVIDTPGLREIQLWGDESGIDRVFDDIEALAAACRFTDCRHESEPDCAIRKAIEEGSLDQDRYESYLKLKREAEHLALRKDVKAERQWHRERDKYYRRIQQEKDDLRKKGLR